ncbi:MAG: DUF4340 domain-containing protein [Planctomycetota bacterium]|nr:DUF4340 domain-containing protein [Planctomycetota bacterium]
MNSKTLIIIAGTTLALVGLATLVGNRGGGSAATTSASSRERLYAGLSDKLADVAKVTIKKGAQEAVLVKNGSNWTVENKFGYPAKFDVLRPIVAGVAEASIIEPKTSKPELYGKLEVEDPAQEGAKSIVVTLADAKGATMASVIVGKQDFGGAASDPFNPPPSDGKTKRFVRRVGEAQSYLVEAELIPQPDALEFVDKSIVEIKNERVKSVVIMHPGENGAAGEVVKISRATDQEKNFSLEGMPEGSKLKDEFAASRIAQSLSYVTLDDVKPASELDWNDSKAVKGTFECFDGTAISFTMVEKDGKQWVKFAAAYAEAPAAPAQAPTAAPAAKPADGPAANGAADINAAAPEAKPAPQPAPAAAKTDEVTEAQRLIKESIKKDAADLEARFSKWAYAVAEFKSSQLKTKAADLIAPATPAATPSPQGEAPAPLIFPPADAPK